MAFVLRDKLMTTSCGPSTKSIALAPQLPYNESGEKTEHVFKEQALHLMSYRHILINIRWMDP